MTRRTLATAAAICLLTACGDSNGPNSDTGAYIATSFTLSESGSVTDVLQEGGSITIRLTSDTISGDSLTTGTLLAPASLNEGTAVAFDMAGTWSRSGDTITFNQNADTFVRDADWLVNGATLTTELASGADTIRATLTLQ